MATPTFSISVPEDEKDAVKQALPTLLDFASVDGIPASLSYLVRQMILSGQRLDTNGLNMFLSRESLKGGDKRYIVITVK